MAITRISQSSIKEGLEKFNSLLAGFSPSYGGYESIATVTVGAGGASQLEFFSIPNTYQHLQIRMISRVSGSTGTGSWFNWIRFGTANTVDAGANYSWHRMYTDVNFSGSGAGTIGADSGTSTNQIYFDRAARSGELANLFGMAIGTILDYNDAKNKTVWTIGGAATDFRYDAYVESGMWMNTNPLNIIRILPASPFTTFDQHTTAALYGIKG